MNVQQTTPDIEQFFGFWSIYLDALAEEMINKAKMQVSSPAAQILDAGYSVAADGLATINIRGVLTKYGAWWLALSGGTESVRMAIKNAEADATVNALRLNIDSPGGTFAGVGALADSVAAMAKKKPVVAVISDLGASAAYWIASQATRIVANKEALVGSIGTYMVVRDFSQLLEGVGIKTYVIKAGERKGDGVVGQEVTEEQRIEFQRVVNTLNEEFLRGVAKGRGVPMETARSWNDGRVYGARDAKRMGLIDSIGNFSTTLREARRDFSTDGRGNAATAQTKEVSMSGTNGNAAQTPVAATLEDLRILPGVTNDFIVDQLGKGVTVDQAQSNWMDIQQKEKEAAQKDAEAARKEAADAQKQTQTQTGLEPVSDGTSATLIDNPYATAEGLIQEQMQMGKSRAQAAAYVMKKNPDLRQAMIDQANKGREQ